MLEIQVADEGDGIRPEDLARIFTRSARGTTGGSRARGGAGLGLAIVDAVAKAHGGDCSVRSSPAGSTFFLRLPRFAAAPAQDRPPARVG
jgi:signal transduction histidine kinase